MAFTIIGVASVATVATFIVVDVITPVTWRTCQGGSGLGGSVCLRDVRSLDEIEHLKNGCLTDGHNVVCGPYWQRQDKW